MFLRDNQLEGFPCHRNEIQAKSVGSCPNPKGNVHDTRSDSTRRIEVCDGLPGVACNIRTFQLGLLQKPVEKDPRPGTRLAVDNPDILPDKVLYPGDSLRVSLYDQEALLPVKKQDPSPTFVPGELGDEGIVVSTCFTVKEVAGRKVTFPTGKGGKPSKASNGANG